MKQHILAFIVMFAVAGSLNAQQAGKSTPAQSDQAASQKQKAESECMAWAKQQAGLGGGESSAQQQSATGAEKQGAATPDKSTGTTPPDKSSQSNTASGMAESAAGMAGSAAGGAT